MSEELKNQLIYEIAEDLIKKFDLSVSNDIINIINKHLYNYEVIEKPTSLLILDDKSERILKMFIGTKKLEGKSENTLKQYYREIKLLLSFLNCLIEEVTSSGVKLYLMTMKTERNLKNSTVENMRSYLSAVFTWVCNENFIKINPCASITPIKMAQEVRESFKKEEIIKIKEACKGDYKRIALIDFLYSTGCRISEVCSVNIQDIDFENKTLVVLGKGNKERRVYLTNESCNSLKKYLSTRDDDNPALFLNRLKNRISLCGVRWIFKDLEQKCGVPNIHPHRFRRTLATDLLDKDMAIQDVAKLLGHAQIDTTKRYYFHTDKKVERAFREIFI